MPERLFQLFLIVYQHPPSFLEYLWAALYNSFLSFDLNIYRIRNTEKKVIITNLHWIKTRQTLFFLLSSPDCLEIYILAPSFDIEV